MPYSASLESLGFEQGRARPTIVHRQPDADGHHGRQYSRAT